MQAALLRLEPLSVRAAVLGCWDVAAGAAHLAAREEVEASMEEPAVIMLVAVEVPPSLIILLSSTWIVLLWVAMVMLPYSTINCTRKAPPFLSFMRVFLHTITRFLLGRHN